MLETKQFGLSEVKFAPDASGMMFEGYGAYFGNVDSYGDVIAKGAFAQTLRDAKKTGTYPAMLLQHGNWLGGDDNMPVGIWTSMKEDDKGLVVEGKLADTQRGKDAYALLKMEPRPAITGLSIGYRVKEMVLGTKPKEPRRTLTAVELFEVSLVTFPANDKARVTGVKSVNARVLEAALRSELKLSQTDAVRAVALVKQHLRDGGAFDGGDDRDGADLKAIADRIRATTATLKAPNV
jgi:HK97 family phage prohead protease